MKYADEHLVFLKKYESMPRKELCEKFNAKFNTKVSALAIKQKCRKIGLSCPNSGRFKKGDIPANKGKKGLMGTNRTSFKPGNSPANTKKVGQITYRADKLNHTYAWIKIAEPREWKMLHVHIWEQANGRVPKGKCVIFKDKNTLNLQLENLMLVSRSELARLNQKYAHIGGELKETALQIIKINQRVRNVQQSHTSRQPN